jgi:predicted small lipoprotein YifL
MINRPFPFTPTDAGENEPMKTIPALLALLLLAGCGTTGPVLYPNAHLQQVGEPQAQKDIAECETLAEQYVKSDAGKEAAKSTAIGGAGGAAGAASGLVHGIIKASEPTPVFKNFMIQCLQDRGYQPIGWE